MRITRTFKLTTSNSKFKAAPLTPKFQPTETKREPSINSCMISRTTCKESSRNSNKYPSSIKNIDQIKNQEIQKEMDHPFHPETNDYNFANRDNTVPVYERLYALGKKPQNQTPQESVYESESQYRPQIQTKSKALQREGKVDDILYKDALRRQEKQKETEKQKTSKVISITMKNTSNNSERIVAQKFIREFEYIVDEIFDQTGQERPSNISYSIDYLKLGEILQRLTFLNQLTSKNSEKAVEYENLRLSEERALLCDIWSILRGDELGGISKRNLCLFLLTLIGITDFKIKELPAQNEEEDQETYGAYALARDEEENKQVQSLPRTVQQNKISNSHQVHEKAKMGSLDGDGNIVFNYEETKKIQKQFDILYRNRLTSEELKKSSWRDENPYKPQVLASSVQMANQYRERLLEETAALIDGEQIKVKIPENGQITHADLLVLQKKTQQYQMELRKKQLEDEELSKCTFKPQVQGGEQQADPTKGYQKAFQLYALAKPAISKRDRTSEEIEYERQIEECTFQPGVSKQFNSSRVSISSSQCGYVNKDVDKTIIRMREARRKREQVNAMLERGYNTQKQDKKKKSLPSTEKKLNTFNSQQFQSQDNLDAHPDSQLNHNDIERVPLLFVDVNLGPGKTERIVVYEGDQSADLAMRFSQEHNLDDFMKDKLKELLDYQISGLLTKIDEEMISVNSDAEQET